MSNLNDESCFFEEVKFDLTQCFEKWTLFHYKKTGVNKYINFKST